MGEGADPAITEIGSAHGRGERKRKAAGREEVLQDHRDGDAQEGMRGQQEERKKGRREERVMQQEERVLEEKKGSGRTGGGACSGKEQVKKRAVGRNRKERGVEERAYLIVHEDLDVFSHHIHQVEAEQAFRVRVERLQKRQKKNKRRKKKKKRR